jgi:hypothetical protein
MQKSILTTLLVTLLSVAAMAQDIDAIRDLAGKSKWAEAKAGIDKYLAIEKNAKKGDGWYLKSVIYNTVSRDTALSGQNPTAKMDAFEAYKKYLELDKDAFEGKLNQHSTLFDVAFGYLQKAGENFNAKKYEEALTGFQNAEVVEEYIVKKAFVYGDFSFPVYDTQLYLNVAAAAVNAKKEDIALEYYKKIADKKIKGPSYEEIYRYIADKYAEKKDETNLQKYLALGKEMYPADPFWNQLELSTAGDDKKKLFAKYDELSAKTPGDYSLHYNYAVELFNYAFVGDKRPDDFAAVETKIPGVIKKAIDANSTLEANMLMCRYSFAHINDLGDAINAIKGTKPDDVKKRSELTAALNKRYDEMLPFATANYETLNAKPTLKAGEKGTMKLVCSMLLEYWERKKDTVKAKMYSDKMKSIE